MKKSQRFGASITALALVGASLPLVTGSAVSAATTTTSSTTSTPPPAFSSGDSPVAGEKRYIIRYADNESDESTGSELSKNNGRLKKNCQRFSTGLSLT